MTLFSDFLLRLFVFLAFALVVAPAPRAQQAAQPEEAEVAPEDSPAHSRGEMPMLTPREVAVVANFSHPYSVELAKHYMAVRDIPESQLLVTGMPLAEIVSRKDYESLIAQPLRDFLVKEKLDHVRCVVLMYGVPLKVLEPAQTDDQRRMQVMIDDERQRSLDGIIELISNVRALGRAPGEPETKSPPAFDKNAPARGQIRQLREAALAAFHDSGKFIKALPEGDVRSRLAALWWEHWRKGFGEVSAPEDWIDPSGAPTPSNADRLARLKRIRDLVEGPNNTETLRRAFDLYAETNGIAGIIQVCEGLEQRVKPDRTWRASVDSELATLFWQPFPLGRYVPNPLQIDYHGDVTDRTLMVCRLDGPNEFVVRTMIDTAAAVEKRGLEGSAYIDARGREGDSAYADYDTDLVEFAGILKENTKIPTVLEKTEALFQPGQCPEAALYVGWYSLAKYVDAFAFNPGAVGYHMASSEAVTLRNPDKQLWCPQLLLHGAVATLGPVEEPFLTAFPLPSAFFGALLTGKHTLVECYYMSLPHVSWMMTLIGDPLYNPYATRPALDPSLLGDGHAH